MLMPCAAPRAGSIGKLKCFNLYPKKVKMSGNVVMRKMSQEICGAWKVTGEMVSVVSFIFLNYYQHIGLYFPKDSPSFSHFLCYF